MLLVSVFPLPPLVVVALDGTSSTVIVMVLARLRGIFHSINRKEVNTEVLDLGAAELALLVITYLNAMKIFFSKSELEWPVNPLKHCIPL